MLFRNGAYYCHIMEQNCRIRFSVSGFAPDADNSEPGHGTRQRYKRVSHTSRASPALFLFGNIGTWKNVLPTKAFPAAQADTVDPRKARINGGDLTWVYNPRTKPGLAPKLAPKNTGPYEITDKLSPVSYIATDAAGSSQRVHIQGLIPCYLPTEVRWKSLSLEHFA